MDYFGINSTADLPKIREVFADQLVEPTIIKNELLFQETSGEATDETPLAVDSNGNLIPQDEQADEPSSENNS